MNPDRRAGIGPQNGLSQEPRTKGSGNLPRWANPVLAARLTLATLTGIGAAVGVDFVGRLIVSAQTACRGTEREFTAVGMQVPFLDMAKIVPAGDRKSIFDKGIDPYLEMPALGGQLKVVDPTSNRELSSSNFTTQPPRIPNVQLPHLDENLAWAVGRWCATPNITMTLKDGRRVPAVEVIIKSSQHPENESYRVTVPAGGILPNWFGREVKKPTDFLDMADKKVAPVRDLDAKKEKLIRDWLAVQKVAVTGVVSPTAASGVTSTVTAALTSTLKASDVYTITKEAQAALEKVMGERLDQAISPLQKDLRDTNDALRDIKTDLRGQNDKFDELSQSIKGLEGGQDKLDKKLTDIKGRLPIASPKSTPGTKPGSTPPTVEDGGLLDGALGAAGFVLDLPAKAVDQVTEPDTQQPIRTVIDVVGWLSALGIGLFAKKKFF